jgi:hypothetical protein
LAAWVPCAAAWWAPQSRPGYPAEAHHQAITNCTRSRIIVSVHL